MAIAFLPISLLFEMIHIMHVHLSSNVSPSITLRNRCGYLSTIGLVVRQSVLRFDDRLNVLVRAFIPGVTYSVTCLKRALKNRQVKTGGGLVQVESIAECSILQYFRPASSNYRS